jgi:glutaredoxin
MYVIISKDNCPWCDKAKELMEKRGLTYKEVNVKENPWLRATMLKAGLTTVPQVFTSYGRLLGGYEALANFLGESAGKT